MAGSSVGRQINNSLMNVTCSLPKRDQILHSAHHWRTSLALRHSCVRIHLDSCDYNWVVILLHSLKIKINK